MRSPQWGKSLAKDAAVCVHMATNRVGVRELRQNLSRYLRPVARGERLQVTERGKPVAVLGPVDESGSAGGWWLRDGPRRPRATSSTSPRRRDRSPSRGGTP